jgi:hypothetical protein
MILTHIVFLLVHALFDTSDWIIRQLDVETVWSQKHGVLR